MIIVDEAHEGIQTDLGEAVIAGLRKKDTKILSLTGTAYGIRKDFADNVFTWTYVDEQKAKQQWGKLHPNEKNPYADLPTMNILTFDLGDIIEKSYRYVTEDSAFNFREFFRTWTGNIENDFYPVPKNKNIGDFVHEDAVWSFLNLITTDNEKVNYPFSKQEYVNMFKHTFWIVPGVKEAHALRELLRTHPFFNQYKIVDVAGDGDCEERYDLALNKVRKAICENDKTITISCGRLTTGITVKEWTAIMMLSGSAKTSVNGYMQAIFRVQSPGIIEGKQKENCYVFDFAPDRALQVVANVHKLSSKSKNVENDERQALGEFLNFCPVIAVEGTEMHYYDVPGLMRQIKRISVESAINSGFDDNTIYLSDAGISRSDYDLEILRKLSDIVAPKKKGNKNKSVEIAGNGLTNEERRKLERAKKKPKKELSDEEKALLEKELEEKKEQKKLFDLLRAVSIRLPLLFYGADSDITEIIKLKDFVDIVDDESWEEFMPKGLRKELFIEISKYYDEDVLVGAGLRIRKLAKAADEYPPTVRAAKIVEILSKFKNPDKETVLTPWKVVNMHMSETLGGYCFYDEFFAKETDEPRLVEHDSITADILLDTDVRILELNSKSGLYPLYTAYSIYKFRLNGSETSHSFENLKKLWASVLENNIFVLCKTKMARSITIRTLAGYTDMKVNAVYMTKLSERMKDRDRLARKLTNPDTWDKKGDRMKFDAVVGNPPYQEMNDNNKMSRSVYPEFVRIAKQIGKKSSLIIPARWTSGENGPYKETKGFISEMIEGDHIKKFVLYPNSIDLFKNVDIKGGICFYLSDSDYSKDEIDYTVVEHGIHKKSSVSFREADNIIIRFPELVSILKKSRNPFGFISDLFEKNNEGVGRISEEKLYDNDYAVWGLQKAKRVIRYIPNGDLKKNFEGAKSYKVFLPRANGSGVFGEVFSTPMTVCTDTFLQVGQFDNATEAENLLKYIKSKYFRAMVGIKKTAVFNYKDCFEFVHVQDFTNNSDIKWSKSIHEIDLQLYKKYAFTQDEIEFVELRVKEME